MRTFYFTPAVAIFFFLLLYFLAYSQRSQTGCLPYFHASCDLNAYLECRSEICCTRLSESENTGCKNYAKNRHLRTIAQYCRAKTYVFATKARTDNRKSLLNSNISSTCPHNMVNAGPLTAEISWRVLGTPANFNGFRVLASLLHQRSTQANQILLCTMFDRLLGWYSIYTFLAALAP